MEVERGGEETLSQKNHDHHLHLKRQAVTAISHNTSNSHTPTSGLNISPEKHTYAFKNR